MLEELKTTLNMGLTENGGLTNRSTLDDVLDFFAQAGALRGAEESRIEDIFAKAFIADADYALRALFYARDIRGGLGERRLFGIALKYLAVNYSKSVIKNLALIPEYGRFDDLLTLLGTPCEAAAVELIKSQLAADNAAMAKGESVSLLAKWLPSVNTSSEVTRARAKRLCTLLKMQPKQYRQELSALRKYIDILESRLVNKDYTFDYSKQPSKAMLKYRKAFIRNDGERYEDFIQAVREGKAELKTGTLYPYDIVHSVIEDRYYRGIKAISDEEKAALDTTWLALPDYCDGRNAIAVVDGSGSMYGRYYPNTPAPIEVAISLGIYFAQRSKGGFAGHFITFSENPRLIEVKGADIYQQVEYCMRYNEVANTNVAAVFELILKTAVDNRLPQSELPETIYLISDMEFDCQVGVEVTHFKAAKAAYEAAGYTLPKVVFWNVCSRNSSLPVTKDETGAVLVSGCSPSIFEMAMSEDVSPIAFMKNVLDGERYKNIFA